MVETFPKLEPVNEWTRSVYRADDMRAGIAALEIESKMFPDLKEASAMVRMLNTCYPTTLSLLEDDEAKKTFTLAKKLFQDAPVLAAYRAVDPKCGLPTRHKFLPNAHEIGAFLREEIARMSTASAMGKRHLAERLRRDGLKAEEDLHPPPTQAQREAVERMRQQFHRDVAALQFETRQREDWKL